MDPATQQRIAAQGGRTAHELGRGHQFTPEEARAAGRKGGAAIGADRAWMAQIGRRGGLARWQHAAAVPARAVDVAGVDPTGAAKAEGIR